MATSLSSPGVETREFDLTTRVPTVATTEGVLAGVFRWGPVEDRILVDSERELVRRFGKPDNNNYETFFTGASFLADADKLYVTRVANTVGSSPLVTANLTSNDATISLSTGDTSNLSVGMVSIGSANGGLKVGATIATIVNTTAFTISTASDAQATTTEDVLQFITNTAFSAVANNAQVANLQSQIVKNDVDFETKEGTFDTDVWFVARYPGELGNSLRVSICGNATGYASGLTLNAYGAPARLTVNTGSNTANVDLFGSNAINSANATQFLSQIQLTDLVEVGNTLIGQQYLKITAIGTTATFGDVANTYALTVSSGNTTVISNNTTDLAAGMELLSGPNNAIVGFRVASVTNSTAFVLDQTPTVSLTSNAYTISPRASIQINFEDPFSLTEDYIFDSTVASRDTVNRYWEFYNAKDFAAPGQSQYNIEFGNSAINNDEVHVVVTDNDGEFTGTPGTLLEAYKALSFATDAKTVDGDNNYWVDVINNRSRYVWLTNAPSGAPTANASNLANSTLDVTVLDFKYGNDGKSETNIELSALQAGYDKYVSTEDIDISLIMQGKARAGVLANYLIDNIAEKRKDCIVLVSPQRGDVVNNVGNETDAIVAYRNLLRSSSYGVLDSGYKYMYDRYNDTYRWVPLNGDIAGLCVRTDRTREPWYSPAGFNRGQIKNVVKLAFNPRVAYRDILYRAGVNSVVTFPRKGTVLFGDKTLLAKPSAFDRINVRRLFIVLKKAISRAAEYTLFEFNDEITRLQFKNLVVPYLADVQGRRGIQDFLVVCDETNNTPEVIDRNEFVADMYIKPARSINFIQLNFIAVPTGVAFAEVVGQF